MIMLAVQTFLLMGIAWILGCVIGCLLYAWFGPVNAEATPAAETTSSAGRNIGRPRLIGEAVSAEDMPKATALYTGHDGDSGGQGVSAGAGGMDAAMPPPVPPVAVNPISVEPERPEPVATSTVVPAAADVGETLELDASDEKAQAADSIGERPPALKSARGGVPDDLKMIKGIGRQNEGRLNALGTYHFDQVASWNAGQCRWVGSYLAFAGRIEREDWVNQAKVLASGEATEFSKRAASGKVSSSSGKAEKVAEGFAGAKPRTMKAPRKSGADKLTQIQGIGNAVEKRLFELGIFHFDQIAKWSDENSAWVGNQIGFPGRVERENWVAKAKALSGK
jgi:predicted flap endonuclease-1-like 5' DNA nuclease